jgi:transposase-like protein
MTSQFKTKKFNALKDKWYKKLEKAGFEDAEDDENHLKQWHSFNFSDNKQSHRFSAALFSSKAEYYRLAGQFLHTHEFKKPVEKVIWTYHADGKTNREISRLLKSAGRKYSSKDYVRLIITALAKEMLKQYGSDNK